MSCEVLTYYFNLNVAIFYILGKLNLSVVANLKSVQSDINNHPFLLIYFFIIT